MLIWIAHLKLLLELCGEVVWARVGTPVKRAGVAHDGGIPPSPRVSTLPRDARAVRLRYRPGAPRELWGLAMATRGASPLSYCAEPENVTVPSDCRAAVWYQSWPSCP